MSFRVLTATFFHETHTFLSKKTTLSDFEQTGIYIGQEVIKYHWNDKSTTDAFLQYANEKKWEVVPTISMSHAPSGMVEQTVVEKFWSVLTSYLKSQIQNIDGIFLILHGAMVSEEMPDVEGALLERISLFQNKNKLIPVVGVLDLHCNFTQKMADFSTCLVAYRKNPHSDAFQASQIASSLLDKILSKKLHPITFYQHPPLLFSPPGTGTHSAPMKNILQSAREIEATDSDILCMNVFGGYSFADIPEAGFSVTCVSTGEKLTAKKHLNELCDMAIAHRKLGHPQDRTFTEVLSEIKLMNTGPILIIEPADNIGGGAPGDATTTLNNLLTSGFKKIVAVINDPESVEICRQAGTGALVSLNIGGKTDAFHGAPISLEAKVKNLTDGNFVLEDVHSHMASMEGINIKMGNCAVIETPQAQILLTSIKKAPMDLGQLRSQGIIPEEAFIILIKAAVAHKQAYDKIAKHSFYVDAPGLCTSNLKNLPFKNINRPIYPLDEVAMNSYKKN